MNTADFEKYVDLRLLLSVEGIGLSRVSALHSKFHSIANILNASFDALTQTGGISGNVANRIHSANMNRTSIRSKIETELVKLKKLGGRVITYWDKDYPPHLKNMFYPPLILYILGNFSQQDQYSIAIVGTRLPTHYGKAQCEKIAKELAKQNITIVSGMARGIDTVAHRAALRNNGRTVAVIGSGLDVIYPAENKKMFNEIIENGAVVSEFELGTKPDAQNFPKRNRIISGLALGTIVVESNIKGGALQTASYALDQNREVFAIPGNLGVKQSEGTNFLIQKGEAKLIKCAEDVLVELEIKLKPVVGKNIPKPSIELNLFEQKIVNSLDINPKHIDQIAKLSSTSVSDCLVHLLSLEFKGMVRQLPGKMFQIT